MFFNDDLSYAHLEWNSPLHDIETHYYLNESTSEASSEWHAQLAVTHT